MARLWFSSEKSFCKEKSGEVDVIKSFEVVRKTLIAEYHLQRALVALLGCHFV